MRYIKSRKELKLVLESESEKLYDGTWEDTFVGMFFSFLGKKVKSKMKSGGLNKLLKQIEKELEKITFIDEIENDNKSVQYYQVYQNIVRLKSSIRNDSFTIDDLKENLEEYIKFHDNKNDSDLPDKVKNAHKEVKNGMEDILSFINNLDGVSESLILEMSYINDKGIEEGLEPIGTMIQHYFNKPMKQGDDVTLKNIKLTGNQKGYKEYIKDIKTTLSNIKNGLSKEIKYIGDDKITKLAEELFEKLSSVSYNDYSTFSNSFEKEIRPLIMKIMKIHGNYFEMKGLEDDVKEDKNRILLKWHSKKNNETKVGFTVIKSMVDILSDDGKILLDKWKELVESSKKSPKDYYIKSIGGGNINFDMFDNIVKSGNLKQIGDVKVNGIEEDRSVDYDTEDTSNIDESLMKNIKEKVDGVFTNDAIYKEKMQISDSELKEVHETLKSKKEDQKNVVDPITILRIFNRAYNSFSITKEEYNNLSSRYSAKVASKKKATYELIGDTARDKKLFQEWNDGILALLQQYGDLLNKPTKKFIIEMLDDNNLFGNRGGQAKLLSKYFDVPLDDAKSQIKNGMKETPGEHKVRSTEDNDIKFSTVTNIEMNTDKIRRIPFIMEVLLKTGESEMMTIYPLKANKNKSNVSNMKVKYTIGDDYGFIKNYMKGINVNLNDKNLKDDLGMNDKDETPVYLGTLLSDNGFIEKSNKYKLTEISKLIDDEGIDNKTIEVKEIFMLLGEKDEGIYRLPSLNKDMKKAIDESPNDKLI